MRHHPRDLDHDRKSLANIGIGIGGYSVSNPSDGIRQGATYDGVLEFHLYGDLQKMGLWKGLCFYGRGAPDCMPEGVTCAQ